MLILWDVQVFVCLQRGPPSWMGFDVVNDEGHDFLGSIPFGLEEYLTITTHLRSKRFRPLKIAAVKDDDFEFIGQWEDGGQRRFEFFGRETDPVPGTRNRMGARGFNVGLISGLFEFFRE